MALPVRVSRQEQYEPFELMRRGFPEMFFGPGRWLGDLMGSADWGGYGVDVREDADHIFVEADLPGFRKEDVDVTLENGILTISAEHREQKKAEPQRKGDYLLRERRYERFQRSFTLPQSVDEQSVNAKLENGCLTITLNKTSQSKAKKIPLA